VILQEKQFAVMTISFEIEGEENQKEALSRCHFLEVPIKVEGKGVLKIKVDFAKQQPNGNNVAMMVD
jgi:hypothetical protein